MNTVQVYSFWIMNNNNNNNDNNNNNNNNNVVNDHDDDDEMHLWTVVVFWMSCSGGGGDRDGAGQHGARIMSNNTNDNMIMMISQESGLGFFDNCWRYRNIWQDLAYCDWYLFIFDIHLYA